MKRDDDVGCLFILLWFGVLVIAVTLLHGMGLF